MTINPQPDIEELIEASSLGQTAGNWRYAPDTGLSCPGMPAFRVDVPLIPDSHGWRFVLDTPVVGQAGS